MDEIFTAIGLLLFIEGLLYTMFPGSMKKMLNSMKDFSEQILSVLISSAVTIISFLAMIKFKLAKKNSLSIVRFEKDKNERFFNFNQKLKELKKEGWMSGKIHSGKEGKEIKIIDPNGNEKYLHVFTLSSKFEKFEKLDLKSWNSESIIAIPKLELKLNLA